MEKCKWYDEELCEECNATFDEFVNDCINEEMFAEMATACINCTKGIMNPTFNKELACDKCRTVIPVD